MKLSSYGYGFQMFTWSANIIVVETWVSGTDDGNHMTMMRVCGQLLGIAAAFITTQCIFPGWAGVDVPMLCGGTIKSCRLSLLACVDQLEGKTDPDTFKENVEVHMPAGLVSKFDAG